MSPLARILVLAAVGVCVAAPAAGAVPAKKLDNNLAALWTTVLETPSAQNPFGTGGPASACFNLGNVGCAVWTQRRRVVHRKARHKDLRRGVLGRVQHFRGAGDD